MNKRAIVVAWLALLGLLGLGCQSPAPMVRPGEPPIKENPPVKRGMLGHPRGWDPDREQCCRLEPGTWPELFTEGRARSEVEVKP